MTQAQRSNDISDVSRMIAEILPILDHSKYKGQAGRVGVIGGSEEYTGAPFFAAITTMRVGADQTHVFCAKDAAVVIKSYSPDLIVHPILDSTSAEKDVAEYFEKLHVLIIGPGLGRKDKTLKTVEHLIAKAREREMPMVIDADGLWLINQRPDIIKSYNKAILTPNGMEAKRLWKAMEFPEATWNSNGENVRKLSQSLGNVGIIVKGSTDIISNGEKVRMDDSMRINFLPNHPADLASALTASVDETGDLLTTTSSDHLLEITAPVRFQRSPVLESQAELGLKRCGGQGDIMSGALGIFMHWAHDTAKNNKSGEFLSKFGPVCCAAYAASALTRRCSKLAFEEMGRSMLASDMLAKIPRVFRDLDGSQPKRQQ